jgi:hypothetical protein
MQTKSPALRQERLGTHPILIAVAEEEASVSKRVGATNAERILGPY